ncbi:MAG: AMIN domain-containing protein, partial [Candidatus Acidiferrales bacterium]
MRIMQRAWGLSALVAASLILTCGALSAADAPVVHVKAVVKDGGVTLQAQANAPFEYTTYRPSESLYVLDLSGVSDADPAGARIVNSDLVKSYRVLTYSSGRNPVVRLEVLLSQGAEPRLERAGNQELTLIVVRAAADTSASVHPVKDIPTTTASEAKPAANLPGSIKQVSLSQNGAQTEVSVIGTAHLDYHALRLQNPDRLVLDFAGSHLRTSTRQIASNLDPVREIRLAQFKPEVSRVLIDLRQPAHYNINTQGDAVTVEFSAASATSGAAKAEPDAQPADLETTKTAAPAAARSVQVVEKQEAPAPAAVVPAPAANLPSSMTQTASALAAPASQDAGLPPSAATTITGAVSNAVNN